MEVKAGLYPNVGGGGDLYALVSGFVQAPLLCPGRWHSL